MIAKQRRGRTLLLCLGVTAGASRAASAQSYAKLDLGWGIEVGGEAERYARALQLAGRAPLMPWSIEPFTPSQIRDMRPTGEHPWQARYETPDTSASAFRVLTPVARAIENTAFPFQVSGGPTWAGRGITADVQMGIAARWHVLYAQVAPAAFAAQNQAFTLAPNGQTDNRRFGDARFPVYIDAPQRFGAKSYARLDPGTSTLAVDALGGFIAFSSAPQRWGPQREYPLVLGPNPGGFPALLIGSSRPWNFWLFRAHARLVYGQLRQSAFAQVDTGETRRLGSGAVVAIEPRGAPGLELGLTRFIHRKWGDFDLATFRRPFSTVLNRDQSAINQAAENQNASAFVRWAIPRARAEVYGEYYREDYPGTFHHGTGSLVEKPDDLASFAIGFQRVLSTSGKSMRVLRGEIVNAETSHQERLERGFVVPIPPYVHSTLVQGHTVNGLILGSPEAYGGAAWRLGLDSFTPEGRRSISLERSLRMDWLPGASTIDVHPDVLYAIRGEALRFTRAGDVGITLIPALDLNRNLVARHDVFNLTAALSWRGW